MATLNNVFPIPTGGAVGINLTTAVSGAVVLSRAVSGSGGLGAFTPLYSGSPLSDTGETCFFLDMGDASPGPLLNGVQYVYQLTDVSGTATSIPVTVASSVDIERIDFEAIVVGLLQGAVNTATLPDGVKPARVLSAMPLGGNPPLPLIFLNQDLVQQNAVPIGLDDEVVGDFLPGRRNVWTQHEYDKHLIRLTVLSLSAAERNFYRDFVIASIRIAVAYAFTQFGADISHSFQAASYQEVDQTNLIIPGFYAADILFEFVAQGNVKVTTNYNLIETITAAVTGTLDPTILTIDTAIGTVTASGVPASGAVTNIQVPTL